MHDLKLHSAGHMVWPFRGDPYIQYGEKGSGRCPVDPTPAYPHNAQLVGQVLDDCVNWFPIPTPVVVHVLEREDLGRTNGFTDAHNRYNREDEPERQTSRLESVDIVLSAKRIPPHPAVTRYVTAHEYGHAVMYAIADRLDFRYEQLIDEYAAMRGIDDGDKTYGAGLWDLDAGEVMACDIRHYLGVEKDYWPHRHPTTPTANAMKFLQEQRSYFVGLDEPVA